MTIADEILRELGCEISMNELEELLINDGEIVSSTIEPIIPKGSPALD